jgi:hypothetical protein
MAGILDFIDQNLGTRLGLLVNDPRAAMQQMNQQAGAYNQASLLATQAERNAMRGLPVTPEQAQAKQYVDKKLEDVAMGFAGSTSVGKFDPRFDPRKLEQARLESLKTVIDPTGSINVPKVNIVDYEGRPFVTSMSDRTAAGGNLVKINDVTLNRPVGLLGGQDYMFRNPGQVWASGDQPVRQIMEHANLVKDATKQNPLYIPWRMAPTGGDFAAMTGESMLNYANAAMTKSGKKTLDKDVKRFIPDWKGVDSAESILQFRKQSDTTRKAIKASIDKNFRNEGGLGIGEARLAVADPRQLLAKESGIMNVGEIYAGSPIIQASGHPSYPRGVPGQGLGILNDNLTIFDLLPNVVKARNIKDPKNPSAADIRSMQMHPYSGVITSDLLKKLGY